MTKQLEDGEKRTVNGIDFYWSRRLRKWVTIPDRDAERGGRTSA